MTKVFIGGSRHLSRLNPAVRGRIEKIIENRLPVVIGDANGADKAVQRFLHQRNYDRVEVFSSDDVPRNNLGGWPVRVIRPAHRTRDFDYYATKDRAMAQEATVGLMIWDGESRGTLLNILRLLAQEKAVVVYVGPRESFVEVRRSEDFEHLIAQLDHRAVRRVHEQAVLEGLLGQEGQQRQLRL